MKTEKQNKTLLAALRFFVRTAVIIAVLYVTLTYVLAPYRQQGNSMSPFFRDGDLGIFFRPGSPKTGEIILYRCGSGKLKAGRVAAIEGQVISYPEGGGYLVNGCVPAEEIPYTTSPAEGTESPVTVPEDSFYILNDFRQITDDSRQEGCVKHDQICGTLVFLFRRRNF